MANAALRDAGHDGGVGLAFVGSLVGARVLDGLTDATFQKISRGMIRVLGAVYLVQGLMGLYAQLFAQA